MEQWTEQTSLRLLALIASTVNAIPVDWQPYSAGNTADIRPAGGPVPAVGVLAALAQSDPNFGKWIRAGLAYSRASLTSAIRLEVAQSQAGDPVPLDRRDDLAERSVMSEADWQLIAEHWLTWLAAEPRAASETTRIEANEDHSFRGVLIDSARAALRSSGLFAQFERVREQVARELAYDMAYGLSHELNNPLANIATRARLLAEEEASERKRQLLAAIVDQAMRGCEMIADLMLIARPPILALEPVELSAVVREAVAKARPWAEARGLSLAAHLADQSVTVTSDRAAIGEALWALLRNAMEVARGDITLTLSISSPGAAGCEPGRAMLSVQDDGPGISPHALAHAFNPYFSGREAGRGLGVGLAKAQRIVAFSGGSASIANAPDRGCIATLWLPLCKS